MSVVLYAVVEAAALQAAVGVAAVGVVYSLHQGLPPTCMSVVLHDGRGGSTIDVEQINI